MIDKRTLRARMRALRDAHGPGLLPVARPFLDRLFPNLVIAAYRPLRAEADPALWVEAALHAGATLALPHVVDRENPIRFLRWAQGQDLHVGAFGLHQPADDAPECRPDIILTPLVGFDRRGNRLGQGAGHYDRAFAAHPDAWRVGLAWGVQAVEQLAPDPWDVPLHAIATESEWIVP
ncbi:5-formyltetrahydrofolate cyclo-ligase [Sphingomonas fuzhouensis]|uniref:5-formyltetrahydrofolate cyclo-ligase n=1 Tax=Sphingomonas fuzhouensis TaxID=3106033 RepID=UPI002AFE08A1|nr:5-formyltetrahydrofolate cyclo-ligase [Sphingomonas sp. SGZ-02]